MITLTNHASTDFRKNFSNLIRKVAEKFSPLQIIRISQRRRLAQSKNCFSPSADIETCDYCLLIITESPTRIDYRMQDFINAHYKAGKIAIIGHDRKTIQNAIDSNSRFFITALSSGELLYSDNNNKDAFDLRPHVPIECGLKALEHYNHRLPLAESFMACAYECMERGNNGLCLFMLHQAVEQCCICLVRIYMAYRSEFHNLFRLLQLTECFSSQPVQIFRATAEDERLLLLLYQSYSAARYRKLQVSDRDTETLLRKTTSFITLVKNMCLRKISELDLLASRYQINLNEKEDEIQQPS